MGVFYSGPVGGQWSEAEVWSSQSQEVRSVASRSELTTAVECPRNPADALVWSFGGTHFLLTVAFSKAVASLHPSKAEQLGAVQVQKENYRGTKGQKGPLKYGPVALKFTLQQLLPFLLLLL